MQEVSENQIIEAQQRATQAAFSWTCFYDSAMFWFGFKLNLDRFANEVNLFHIVFLGIGASALCFVTWNYAVKVIGAVKTSLYIYLVPAKVRTVGMRNMNDGFESKLYLKIISGYNLVTYSKMQP